MGEFEEIAERLAKIVDESVGAGGIYSEDIPGIVSKIAGDILHQQINCYPGVPCSDCYETAKFVSLNSKASAIGRGHLSCRKALEKMVQHMRGQCPGKTKIGVLYTDSWDVKAWDDWKAIIQNIMSVDNVYIEAYLMIGGKKVQIPL